MNKCILLVGFCAISFLTACGEANTQAVEVQNLNQAIAKQQQIIQDQQQELTNRGEMIQQMQQSEIAATQQAGALAATQQQQQAATYAQQSAAGIVQPVQQVAQSAVGAVAQVANDTTVQDMMLGGLMGYAAGSALSGGSNRGGNYSGHGYNGGGGNYHRNVVNHTTIVKKTYVQPRSSSQSFFKSNRSSRSFGSTRSYRRR